MAKHFCGHLFQLGAQEFTDHDLRVYMVRDVCKRPKPKMQAIYKEIAAAWNAREPAPPKIVRDLDTKAAWIERMQALTEEKEREAVEAVQEAADAAADNLRMIGVVAVDRLEEAGAAAVERLEKAVEAGVHRLQLAGDEIADRMERRLAGGRTGNEEYDINSAPGGYRMGLKARHLHRPSYTGISAKFLET